MEEDVEDLVSVVVMDEIGAERRERRRLSRVADSVERVKMSAVLLVGFVLSLERGGFGFLMVEGGDVSEVVL